LKFGVRASSEVGYDLRKLGARRVLVVTDPTLKRQTRIVDAVVDHLVKAGLEVDVWDGVEPEPTEDCVVEGIKYASERRYDAFVGLEKFWDLEAYRLGAGQLKMLEVARALAVNAKLVALDEPIGGTDPKYAHDIFTKLRELPGKVDVTFLIIEHRIDIALPYADYVYVMDRGRVIAEGKPDEVVNNPRVIEVYIGEKK
jgi:ABC-type glutathione transport system ATPase component